jgi:hypothetical protein
MLYIVAVKKPEITIATGKVIKIGPISLAISIAVCFYADRLCKITSDRKYGSKAA